MTKTQNINEFMQTTAKELTAFMETLEINKMGLEVDITKGKKLRGSMTILISKAVSGDLRKAFEFASAVELIHLGSIVHDDIIDEHKERRGSVPLNLLKGAKLAVLSGDRMFSLATKIASTSGNKEAIEVADAMETVLSGAMKEISINEFIKDSFTGQVADKFYHKMIALKTAGLFKSAGRFGAMSATDEKHIINRFGNFGESVGMAYQIADDLTDIIKMADGKTEPEIGNIISILPAVIHYNKDKIKRTPFSIISGRMDVGEILELISSIDMSGNMKSDIIIHIKNATDNIKSFEKQNEFTELLTELPGYCVDKILDEVGEKL